jgi:hypothetical protein
MNCSHLWTTLPAFFQSVSVLRREQTSKTQRHAASSLKSLGQARIERIAQAVAEQVHRKHRPIPRAAELLAVWLF